MRRVNLLRAHGSPTGYLYKQRHHPCRCVACRAAAAESSRKYYADHIEEEVERKRQYSAEHPEKSRERWERYNGANRDLLAEKARRRRAANPEKAAEKDRRSRLALYGLVPEQWDAMFAAQGNSCAICGTTEPGSKIGWCTDHDHKTGVVRGILCPKHNTGLSNFDDNPEHLMAAIGYLAAATL